MSLVVRPLSLCWCFISTASTNPHSLAASASASAISLPISLPMATKQTRSDSSDVTPLHGNVSRSSTMGQPHSCGSSSGSSSADADTLAAESFVPPNLDMPAPGNIWDLVLTACHCGTASTPEAEEQFLTMSPASTVARHPLVPDYYVKMKQKEKSGLTTND
jgi:hypothetical protein